MIKMIFISAVLFSTFVFSDALQDCFGLRMGMLRSQFPGLKREADTISKDDFKLQSVPQPSELFKNYYAAIAPKGGLYTVEGESEPIKTKKTGEEIRAKFNLLKATLCESFGTTGVLVDELAKGEPKNPPVFWTEELMGEKREYSFTWSLVNGAKLPRDVDEVTLYITMDTKFVGTLNILYSFKNAEAAELEGIM
jgi:hypothetical protein